MKQCQKCKKRVPLNMIWISKPSVHNDQDGICCIDCLRELDEDLKKEIQANEN